ncbi:dipeptide/oligopeptide/nickel ABC transporter permease/ATP-binding protein [Microbacterium sp. 5K110]|jgi:peptide/nickel transport system permease protein|uniref:dipeptide/oligopeptide/nickel ABC transporter permease/ATP-binding protein n=1 Tax=unclassified Microbacterium TaxID=2609290 RepID=UPI0010FDC090|nr:dipeptide/oligopeptide/nickel ABC transporter permease/ATP-binding protein [Microbacterium sp. 5K110]TLF32677.1 dipeptide/oligopeptide/nickel ABC transporter permease/ATP-binding protein [Microbacterium sp. 5K110]
MASSSASRRPRLPRPTFGLALAALWLIVIVVGCFGAPLFTGHDPIQQDLSSAMQLPSLVHPLGTDALGRDVLSRLLYGGRVSLLSATEAVLVAATIGVSLGLIAGYSSRAVDTVISRVFDVVQSVPVIVLLLAILAMTGRNIYSAMAVFGLITSPVFYRLSRDAARSASAEAYVDAARVSGLPEHRILLRHVAPNIVTPVLVQASVILGIAMLTESGLNFLGLGTPPPAPSWGGLVSDASAAINRQPWLMVPSGLVIVFTVLSFAVIGDHLRSRLRGAQVSGAPWRPTLRKRPLRITESGEADGVLDVRDLTVRVATDGGATILHGVDLSVRAGERVALVGESGSGKTMTAMAILGLIPRGVEVDGGSIRFEGQQLLGRTDAQLNRIRGTRLAYIGQEPMVALDPVRTVYSQISEVLETHRIVPRPQVRARVMELLTKVNLRDAAGVAASYPHQLSGGMAQRVCIAMALAGEPTLLIADEPTTALDVTVQAEILLLLRSLTESTGMALVLVTHDFGVVADIADRAVVMRNGSVVEEAPVEELFASPTHPYTRALLAANPYGRVPLTALPTLNALMESR